MEKIFYERRVVGKTEDAFGVTGIEAWFDREPGVLVIHTNTNEAPFAEQWKSEMIGTREEALRRVVQAADKWYASVAEVL